MLLKKPITINKMEIANRIVMPPMATYKSDNTGLVNDDLVNYYAEYGKGGHIGLLIMEHSFIMMQGRAGIGQTSLASDDVIEPMKKLTAAVQADGTKMIAQINHAGSGTNESQTGMPIVSASVTHNPCRKPQLVSDVLPLSLTKEEILGIQDAFVKAALRVKEAGFAGVEIHSAHGYLLDQFYSPLTNLRDDEYGCASVENRVRFQVETIKKVREAVGPDYPVLIRLGGCDYREGGATIADAVEASKLFEAAGVDAIDLSGGMCGYTRKDTTEAGWFADMSEEVKKAVNVPVIVTGGVNTPAEAEALLEAGKADMIGVGRAMLKDKDWAKKAMM